MDTIAIRELELHAYNTSRLHNQFMAIAKNLTHKYNKGIYDKDKAVKGWMYWVESAAKDYCKEYGGIWNDVFPIAERRELARIVEDNEIEEIKLNNYL